MKRRAIVSSQSRRQQASNRRAVLAGMFAAGLVLASLALGAAARLSEQPIEAAITPVTAHLAAARARVFENYRDTYVAFRYPATWHRVPVETPQLPILSNMALSGGDITPVRLSVTTLVVPTRRLDDNGAYQLRVSRPQSYQLERLMVDGEAVPVVRDKTASEYSVVAFLMHGERQATIALSGIDMSGDESLQRTLEQILQSWQWL